MKNKFFAFYENNLVSEVAVFDTEKMRNAWVSDETNFPRSPLSYNEAVDILACDPATARREEDVVYDGVIWLMNPEFD